MTFFLRSAASWWMLALSLLSPLLSLGGSLGRWTEEAGTCTARKRSSGARVHCSVDRPSRPSLSKVSRGQHSKDLDSPEMCWGQGSGLEVAHGRGRKKEAGQKPAELGMEGGRHAWPE